MKYQIRAEGITAGVRWATLWDCDHANAHMIPAIKAKFENGGGECRRIDVLDHDNGKIQELWSQPNVIESAA
jgi:hypothetical protein